MIKILVPFLLFLCTFQLKAQPKTESKDYARIVQLAVLPDRGYSFNQLLEHKSLPFVVTDSLKNAKAFWVRAIFNNEAGKTQSYILRINQDISTKFYFFDQITNRWTVRESAMANYVNPIDLGIYSYQIEKHRIDTVYFWTDLHLLNNGGHKLKVKLDLKLKEEVDHLKQETRMAWSIGVIVLFLFFLNYLYVYFGLRDKPMLFYLVMQIGGMIYLTGYWEYFWFPKLTAFNFILTDHYSYYDINNLLTHVAIVTIFYSYVQLTRSYLNTSEHLPFQDRLLKYILNVYIIGSVILAVFNIFVINYERYTVPYDNVYCALLIFTILYTTVKAYLVKIPLAEPYLLSNLVPLILMLCMPLYHLLVSFNGAYNHWIPVLCVISQALGFSIALVNRTKAIQEMLKLREIESRQLEFNLKEVGYQNKLNEMQMIKMNADMQLEKNRNELLQGRLELHQRELASSTLNMVQKSELLTFLKDQLQKLNWLDRYHTKKNLHELNVLLESNIQLDSEWAKFKLHFEQVHPEFFENLKRDYSTLTQKEVRLYTYFQMKLTHKEIAALLAIDPASVRRAKTRLYKKMNIAVGKDQQLDEQTD